MVFMFHKEKRLNFIIFYNNSNNLTGFRRIKEREQNKSRNRTIEIPFEDENETLTHFSTFALSAEDGTLLWKHGSGDFEETLRNSEVSLQNVYQVRLALYLTNPGLF